MIDIFWRLFISVPGDRLRMIPPRQWWSLPNGLNSRDRFNSALSDAPNIDWSTTDSNGGSSFLPCELQVPTPIGFGDTIMSVSPAGKSTPPIRRSSKGQTNASDNYIAPTLLDQMRSKLRLIGEAVGPWNPHHRSNL